VECEGYFGEGFLTKAFSKHKRLVLENDKLRCQCSHKPHRTHIVCLKGKVKDTAGSPHGGLSGALTGLI